MHPKERYEEIITSKLAALPLPDMADAIWLRIERQLDIDLPTDDGGDVPEPPSPWDGGGMTVGAGFLAVVGAILTIFYFNQPNTANNTPLNTTTNIKFPVQNSTTTRGQALERPFIKQANSSPTAQDDLPPPEVQTRDAFDVATVSPTQDSGISVPDNITAQSLVATLPVQPDVQTDSVPKKRRGLQDVSDNDYRIVPKKNNDQ